MAIVVTGATGFVPSNVVRALVQPGRAVVAIDRRALEPFVAEHFGPAERWRFAQADVTDFEALRAALGGEPVEAFVHMAALTPSAEVEASDPLSVIQVNVGGTANALELARQAGARRFVLTSSAAVYAPGPEDRPVPEAAPFRHDRVYSVSKQMGETLIAYYAERHGLEAAAVRICGVYGPMERPTGARTVMSPIYQAVALALAGEPVRVAEAGVVRDFIHAADVARGIRSLLEGPPPAFCVYNLAPGHGHTVADLLDTLTRVVPGSRWEVVASEPANLPVATDNRRGPLDVTRIAAERGFAPAFSLEAGLRDYVGWLRSAQPSPIHSIDSPQA